MVFYVDPPRATCQAFCRRQLARFNVYDFRLFVVVAGAKVRLTHELTKNNRDFATETNGEFVFTNLIPGDYDIMIQQAGFKTYGQSRINVSSDERVDLHQITLAIGTGTESMRLQPMQCALRPPVRNAPASSPRLQ